MALSQSTLDASQIELILSSKGLQGEILKLNAPPKMVYRSTKYKKLHEQNNEDNK